LAAAIRFNATVSATAATSFRLRFRQSFVDNNIFAQFQIIGYHPRRTFPMPNIPIIPVYIITFYSMRLSECIAINVRSGKFRESL